jgi:hypothetical protein
VFFSRSEDVIDSLLYTASFNFPVTWLSAVCASA